MYEIENFASATVLKSLLVKSAYGSYTLYIGAEQEESVLDVLFKLYEGMQLVVNVMPVPQGNIQASDLAGILISRKAAEQLRVFSTRRDCMETAITLSTVIGSVTAYVVVAGAIKCKVEGANISDFVDAHRFVSPSISQQDCEKLYTVYHPVHNGYL